MDEFFKNKYRVASTRLPAWDYSRPGYYFITICVQDRGCYFGEIKNGIIGLSAEGLIAYKFWVEIAEHFKNVNLDEFIVMPNHIHGILQIFYNFDDKDFDFKIGDMYRRDAPWRVSTTSFADIDNPKNWTKNKFGPLKSKSLSSIVNAYKSSVKRYCKHNGLSNFKWQERFYDRIIRNEEELIRIRKYIHENPRNWTSDRNNPNNLN